MLGFVAGDREDIKEFLRSGESETFSYTQYLEYCLGQKTSRIRFQNAQKTLVCILYCPKEQTSKIGMVLKELGYIVLQPHEFFQLNYQRLQWYVNYGIRWNYRDRSRRQ